MPLSAYQVIVTSNSPVGSDYMDSSSPEYLVTELQDLKATVRAVSLSEPWGSLTGLTGSWTGTLTWTYLTGTTASIQGDQTIYTGGEYLAVGQRVRAYVTAGTIYGYISNLNVAGGNTTATFVWDNGAALDSGLSDIQIVDFHITSNDVMTQTQVPTFAVISNIGGSQWSGTISPAPQAGYDYLLGQVYRVQWFGAASQGNDTLALNGLAQIPIMKDGGTTPILVGDIQEGAIVDLFYDENGNFQVYPAPRTRLLNSVTGNPYAHIVSTTAGDLYSFTVPGNAMGTKGILKFIVEGEAYNGSGGSVSFEWKFSFGASNLLLDTGAISIVNNVSGYYFAWRFEAEVINTGATNAQFISGIFSYGTPAVTNGLMGNTNVVVGIHGGATVDTTLNQPIELDIVTGRSGTTIVTNSYMGITELINGV